MHMEVLMDMEAGWVINRVRVGTGAGEEMGYVCAVT